MYILHILFCTATAWACYAGPSAKRCEAVWQSQMASPSGEDLRFARACVAGPSKAKSSPAATRKPAKDTADKTSPQNKHTKTWQLPHTPSIVSCI